MNNPYHASATVSSGDVASDEKYEPEVFAVDGRIGRLRYIAYSVAVGLSLVIGMGILLAIFGMIHKDMAYLAFIVYVPIIAYQFILAIRRLNDMGNSGWFSLLQLIPVVNLFFYLWLLFAPGDESSNAYGQAPVANTGLVIAGACVFPMIFVLGILAAIAIPQYSKYLERARAAKTTPANHPAPAPATLP